MDISMDISMDIHIHGKPAYFFSDSSLTIKLYKTDLRTPLVHTIG